MRFRLDDICEKITDGSHYSPKAVNVGYPMFSVKDMLEYGFSYDNCKRVDKEDFDKLKGSGCVPQEGDVLVAKDGSYLKEIFVCREEREEAILSSIAIFRPNQRIISPDFLCYLLKSPRVYNYIKNNCVSGSALPRIVLKEFKTVEVDVPDAIIQNRIVAMLEAQLFNILCDLAGSKFGGRLPIHVRFILDEFSNIGKIPEFEKIISVIRSREISACIILQSKAQLKALYKDHAGTIADNCDSQLFLGGRGDETLKELSGLLGKETIDIQTTSDTRGQSPYFLRYRIL